MATTHPTRDDIIQRVAQSMYAGRVLNNAHRGDVVEMIVLAALEPDWIHVGLGWHPWDLEHATARPRRRIQVRQTAALQIWGPTKSRSLHFGWKKNAPYYFEDMYPDIPIESEGWFCDIFVFGLHDETDAALADQCDPSQWSFMVIPTSDLNPGTNTMGLAAARERWETVEWSELAGVVERMG